MHKTSAAGGVLAESPVSPEPPPAPYGAMLRYFGDYELLGEVGRGGMGVVYKARQLSLNRIVALKVIAPEQLASPKAIERFHTEAEAAASLDHPNIVPIYQTGELDGRHYFSMKLIEGQSLAQRIDDFRLPVVDSKTRGGLVSGIKSQIATRQSQFVILMAKVAEAVHYAHQRGILHRDLKPGNILIDKAGEAHVTDFGLARRVEDESSLTLSGEILGTPAYMAPEQAAGKANQITTSADVYSLGVILYELLAGQPPFAGATSLQILHALLHNEPTPPRATNLAVSRDLETICLKCLEKQPSHRYATALELAEELRRFEHGEPIRARAVTLPEKMWRWCRRKPALAATLGLLHVALAIGFGGILWQWQRAEANAAESRRIAYASDMTLAQHALQLHNLGRARSVLRRQRPRPGQEDLRGFEWRYLWQLSKGDELHTFYGHSNVVAAVALSPDGTLLATAGLDEDVRLWDVKHFKPIRTLERSPGRVNCLSFTPDGSSLAVRDNKGVGIWEVASWQRKHFLQAPPCDSVCLNAWMGFSDGAMLAVRVQGGMQLWDTDEWKQTGLVSRDDPKPFGALDAVTAMTVDGKTVAFGSERGDIELWDLRSQSKTALLKLGPETAALAFSPNGKLLAAGGSDGSAKLWSVESAEEIAAWNAHESWLIGLAFSPNGRVLATGGADQLVRLWDIAPGILAEGYHKVPAELTTLYGHGDQVWALSFTKNGEFLVSGSQDGTAKLWRAESVPSRQRFTNWVGGFWLSNDGQTIESAESGGTLNAWNVVSGELITSIRVPTPPEHITSSRISRDGRLLVQATESGALFLWELPSGVSLGTIQAGGQKIYDMKVSANGRRLLTISDTGLAEVWDLGSRLEIDRLNDRESGGSISPDGRYVAIARRGTAKVNLRDVSTHRDRALLQGVKRTMELSVFSPDGRLVATGGSDNLIRLWRVPSGQLVAVLEGHTTGIEALAFSPDGKTLVSSANYGNIKLWQVATGQEMLSFRELSRYVSPIIFSGDGTTLAVRTSAPDGRGGLQFWRAPSLLAIAAEDARGQEFLNEQARLMQPVASTGPVRKYPK